MPAIPIHIARGVTEFPDDATFHTEQLTPPTHMPLAALIKVVIEGNTVTHWWQATGVLPPQPRTAAEIRG